MTPKRDLTGTAKCGECLAVAHYPTRHDPSSGPLSIHHTSDCSQRDGAPPRAEEPLVDQVRRAMADDVRPYLNPFHAKVFAAYVELAGALDSLSGGEDGQAEEVIVDKERGHITVSGYSHGTEQNRPARNVTFVDLGPVLSLWSGQGVNLTPQLARQLGKALVGWADRKNPPPFDLMITLTGDALHELSEAADDRAAMLHTLRLAVDQGTLKIKENEYAWGYPLTDGVLIQEGHDIP